MIACNNQAVPTLDCQQVVRLHITYLYSTMTGWLVKLLRIFLHMYEELSYHTDNSTNGDDYDEEPRLMRVSDPIQSWIA